MLPDGQLERISKNSLLLTILEPYHEQYIGIFLSP